MLVMLLYVLLTASVHVSVTCLTLTWHHKLMYCHHQTCFYSFCDCCPAGHLHTSCLGQWYTCQFLAPQQPAPLESNAGVLRQSAMVPCHCKLSRLYVASTPTNLYSCAHLLLTWSLHATQLVNSPPHVSMAHFASIVLPWQCCGLHATPQLAQVNCSKPLRRTCIAVPGVSRITDQKSWSRKAPKLC